MKLLTSTLATLMLISIATYADTPTQPNLMVKMSD